MTTSKLVLSGVAVLALAIAATAATPTFTGDVEADFTGPGILTISDSSGDVGLPGSAPGGTVSGWDMKDIRLTYDLATDTLYVGINAFGIAGDADGDGDPGATSAWLGATGGADIADFGTTESFAVFFDLDQDGTFDVIAGVSSSTNLSGFSVNDFSGNPGNPAGAFGTALPGNTGSVAVGPDVEFTITNFSALADQDALLAGFEVRAFMGSLEDDGIGEDFVVYEQSPTTVTDISASPTSVVSGGSVSLTITEENDGDVDLANPQVVVTKNGAPHATLTAAPDSGDDGDGVLEVGETWSWTISSGPITIDPTAFVATGSGTAPGDFAVTYPADPEEQDSASVNPLTPSTITTITSSDPTVVIGESVDLTITEENDGEVDLTSPQVVVTKNGAPHATLTDPPDSGDDGDGVLEVGETWTWTISSGPITVDPTTFVAIGSGTDPAGNVITYPGDPDERDEVSVGTLTPSTITTITSSAAMVDSGDSVDLTITEENDGQVDLTSPQVVVEKGGVLLATLGDPPDSGDDGDGVLEVGEIWTWTIDSGPITATTTFLATGSGIDPAGNVITYPGDPDEQDSVTVEVMGAEGCTPGYWKNSPGCWECLSPSQSFEDFFSVDVTLRAGGRNTIAAPTMMQALEATGGGVNALARHAVAAILNACDPDVAYPMSVGDIIGAVQAAIAAGEGEIKSLATMLDMYNNYGCPQSADDAENPCSPEVDEAPV